MADIGIARRQKADIAATDQIDPARFGDAGDTGEVDLRTGIQGQRAVGQRWSNGGVPLTNVM